MSVPHEYFPLLVRNTSGSQSCVGNCGLSLAASNTVCRLSARPGILPRVEAVYDTWLTPKEAVAYTRLSRQVLWQAERTGQLPISGSGRGKRYRRQDLDAWMASRKPAKDA